MKTSHKFIRGFTLIELLIVIAITAILTGIITTSLTPAKSKARDAKRISDIGQLQVALSLYFDRCKEYPATITGTLTNINNGCPSGVNLATYISTIPKPPSSPLNQTDYGYNVYTYNSKVVNYVLSIKLENPNEVVKDGLAAAVSSPAGGTWTPSTLPTCSVTNGVDYCISSR